MVNRENIVEKFIELVEIDSLSRKERQMADRLTEELVSLGFNVTEDNVGEKINGEAGNLIAELKGNPDLPVVLLSAHMDRVEPGEGIKAEIKDGYIYSKGETVLAGDDIIGVVSILEAVKELKQEENHPTFLVVFSVAEEVGLLGASHLDESVINKADHGIVIDVDGDVGTVVNRAPGQKKFNVIIRGQAAHAGMEPEKGVNAIKIASHAISNMNLGRIDKETTANIGVIRGGSASNIVPDMVELEGEVRSHNREKLLSQVEDMKNAVIKYTDLLNGSVEFDIEQTYHNFKVDSETEIVKITKTAAEKNNLPFKLASSGGGSDANVFNSKGLPTINLGSAMEEVHSTDERVKIDNIVRLTEFLISILKSFK